MTTMTEQNRDVNEIDDLSPEFWESYQDATPSASRTLPPDGRYHVRMPDQIPDSAFVVKEDRSGRKYLQITLDPLTLVSDQEEIDGYTVRYLRVSTLPETQFTKDGDQWKATGTLNASSAADVILNFESDLRPRTVEEWKLAFRQLEGRVSPSPFYLVWTGYDKAAVGRAKYLKSKDFPTLGDGTRPNFLERTDDLTGQPRRVWANLSLGFRGAAPRT
jgi:hypothetical protein